MNETLEADRIPSLEVVGDLIGGLLNTTCSVRAVTDILGLTPESPVILADYVDTSGNLAGVVLVDMPFVCRAGAALVSLAPADADAALENGSGLDDLIDTYREVATVLSRLFGPATRLSRVFHSGSLLPASRRAVLTRSIDRGDFDVDITGYGQGRVCIVRA